MASTSLKKTWHSSKHMKTTTSQDAHINHGKNDKRARSDNRQPENIMKHSYNDDSGINMSLNEYDAME